MALEEDKAPVETVVCPFVEPDVGTSVDVVIAGVELAAEVGAVVVGEALVEAPVPTGTFWR